jgi:hypothetical protein
VPASPTPGVAVRRPTEPGYSIEMIDMHAIEQQHVKVDKVN